MTDYTFQGWLGYDAESVKGQMKWDTFEPKKWTEDDVDIKITHCGICGSDVHTLRSGWGAVKYPCCTGHEIVGTAVRVGSNAKDLKVGDRVAVGAQARSCLSPDCVECSVGRENYCRRSVHTYNSVFPEEGKAYGGYADYHRTHHAFVFRIPDGLASELAAPMMCAGVTMFSPLRQNGCGPGKKVGIVGIGGLGHFGIMFAKAMGADRVVGISRRASKRDEVLSMGADEYIATADDEGWATKNARSLDLIISTVSGENMPFSGYLGLLRPGGNLIQVGAPDGGNLPPINAFSLIASNVKVGGSLIGSPGEIRAMLDLAADKGLKPWVQTRPMADANQAIQDMAAGKARYRYVLVNEKHIGAAPKI